MSSKPRYVEQVESGEIKNRITRAWELARKCRLCPRECGVDRTQGETGVCGAGDNLRISRFIRHRGEEPVLSGTRGSGTVFFSYCGLRCAYCQNWQISFEGEGMDVTIAEFAKGMLELQNAGVHNINWVTPSHYLPWVLEGLNTATEGGLRLPLVYNCGGYESLQALELLDGVVDIYLPDAKYSDSKLAKELSDAPDYPEINRIAIAEMWRQVEALEVDDEDIARKGLIARHLVIPGKVENTKGVLRMLTQVCSLDVAISLMGQYFPSRRMRETDYNRSLTATEYQEAADYMIETGFENGWIQHRLGVELKHRPDFSRDQDEMN